MSFVMAKCTFFVFLSAFLCDEQARKEIKNVSDEFEAFANNFARGKAAKENGECPARRDRKEDQVNIETVKLHPVKYKYFIR